MSPLRALPPGGEPLPAADVLRALRRGGADFAGMLSRYLGGPHCRLASSGTAALVLGLKALKGLRPERAEVTLPAYTCPHVLSAVVLAGLEPVLCDVSPEGSGLDLSGLRRRLGPRTLAVVCVHLFGVPANIEEVGRLAREQGAFVVEDAAQALGNEAAGRRLGTLGDIGVFSFGRGKPLSLGSGGAVVTVSAEIAQTLEAQTTRLAPIGSGRDAAISLLYGLFFRPSLYWLPRSLPFLHLGETVFTLDIEVAGMSEFAAALGAELLPRYEASRLERARRGAALTERLEGGRLLQPLGPLGAGNAYLRLPLLVEEGRRQELLARLARLGATGMYPLPLGELRGTANHLGPQAAESYPHARRLSRRLLTLPLHGLLLERDLQEIERTLHETPGAPVAETT